MKVNEAMTREVRITSPEATVQRAASMMAELDVGALPVADDERLVGMITDRDIAIRGVAGGRGPEAKVQEVMTVEVMYCFDDQDLDEVARNMAELQVRRLPVVNRQKRLVGILSLGDVALSHTPEVVGEALSGISRPGGQRSQSN
jgi:CBS domain-containing protein